MPTGSHLRKDSARFATEQQATAIQRRGGIEYWAPFTAFSYLRTHCPKLSNTSDSALHTRFHAWQKGCRWLDGKTLTPEPLTGLFGKTTNYYKAGDIRSIVTAMNELPATPPLKGHTLLDDVAKAVGCHRDHALWLFRKWRKSIGNPKLQSKLQWGRSSAGHPVRRSYVPDEFADWAILWKDGDEMPAGHITLTAASMTLGKPKGALLPIIERRGIDTRLSMAPTAPGVRLVRTVDKAILRNHKTRKPKPEQYSIGGETLLPRALALKEYPHVPAYVYYTYPNLPCPLLDGEVLRAPKIAWPNGYRLSNDATPRGFVEEQLKRFPRMKVHKRLYSRPSPEAAVHDKRPKAMPSAHRDSTTECLESVVRPRVVVDEFGPHALAQIGIGVTPPKLRGKNRLIYEAMRLKDSMAETDFVEHVWGADGVKSNALKQQLFRFNSDPEATFQLSQERGYIVKVK